MEDVVAYAPNTNVLLWPNITAKVAAVQVYGEHVCQVIYKIHYWNGGQLVEQWVDDFMIHPHPVEGYETVTIGFRNHGQAQVTNPTNAGTPSQSWNHGRSG